MNRALILGGGALGVLLLYAAMNSGSGGLTPDRVDALLTAQYGVLPAGLRWRDLVWSPTAERLGLENLPTATQARRLQALVGRSLAPVSNLTSGQWIIRQGFTSSALARVLPHPCPLAGHDNGTALDVQMWGYDDAQTFGLLRTTGAVFDRAVLAGGHVHVELGDGAPARRSLVQLPSGLLVPSVLV